MPVTFAELIKVTPLPGLVVRTADGKMGTAPLAATTVQYADKKTAEEKATEILSSIATIDATLTTHGGTITTLQTDLDALEVLWNNFYTGEANGGTLDRLTELVAEINANRNNIGAITANKVAKTDIVNDLTTGGVDKVLSAEQGKALKGLLDAMEASITTTIAGLHTHSNKPVLDGLSVGSAGVESGKLLYNGTMVGDLRMSAKVIDALPENNIWPADMHPQGVMFYIPAATV